MDNAQLTEIEDTLKRHPGPPADDHLIRLLIAEIRRLQALVDEYEMGHRVPVGRAYNRGGL